MLESILRLRRYALHQQDVGLGEPFQRGLQRRFLDPRHVVEEAV